MRKSIGTSALIATTLLAVVAALAPATASAREGGAQLQCCKQMARININRFAVRAFNVKLPALLLGGAGNR